MDRTPISALPRMPHMPRFLKAGDKYQGGCDLIKKQTNANQR